VSFRVPIITYHSIDERGTILSTAPGQFAAQIAGLARRGWRTESVSAVAAAIRERRPLPPKRVVLTFDDGYRNFAEHAWPVLRDAGFGATLFALGDRTIAANVWDHGPGTLGGEPLLDAAGIARLAEEGVEIGAHSMTHARLPSLDANAREREIAECQRALAETAARPVRVFAYPYGALDDASRALVAAHYDAGCSTRMGFATASSDRYRLARIDAYYLRNPRLVEALDAFATRAYLGTRALLRRARSAYG
jgi:peptidoglycan/xylan/chitin deacetylase (PgdA/CDA1 family)